MTREEIERIGIGDFSAMAKLAATIKPLEKSGQTAGPILRQFTKATEIPDYISPGASISGPTRHGSLNPPRTATGAAPSYGPVQAAPVTVPVRDPFPSGIELTGDYGAVRDELEEYARVCAEHFRSSISQQYPGIPELWNMPAPAREEAPPRWGLDRAELYDVERKQKAQYQRIASDTTQRLSVRKGAADVVMGYEVADPRMRRGIAKHQANLAARELLRDHSGNPVYTLALQGILSDESVPAAEREKARRELQALA